jgi:hypothetical protein
MNRWKFRPGFPYQNVQEDPERFSDSEVERPMTLNRRLEEIESLKLDTAHELRSGLIDKIKNTDDPMGDFEIDIACGLELCGSE